MFAFIYFEFHTLARWYVLSFLHDVLWQAMEISRSLCLSYSQRWQVWRSLLCYTLHLHFYAVFCLAFYKNVTFAYTASCSFGWWPLSLTHACGLLLWTKCRSLYSGWTRSPRYWASPISIFNSPRTLVGSSLPFHTLRLTDSAVRSRFLS